MTKVKSKHKSTITIQDFLKAINYKISGSTEYGWQCFGSNAQYLDYNSKDISTSTHIIFDTKTQRVFECEVWTKDTVYRWFNRGCKHKHDTEAIERGIDPKFAIDELKYTDISDASKVLKLVKKIAN